MDSLMLHLVGQLLIILSAMHGTMNTKFDFRWECICALFFSKTASSRIT